MRYLAEAWRDYSETEYVCVARQVCDTREEAEKFLENKCNDFQKITPLPFFVEDKESD